jgi:membrane protein involved in colicin uptake
MSDDNIPIKILNAIQQAGTEVVEVGIKGTEKVLKTVITGQELVADAKPMSDQEMTKAKAEDERKKQEELDRLRNGAPASQGRNVSEEMRQVDQEEKSEEEQKQQEFLEKIKQQREAEEAERSNLMMTEPGNSKREAKKRQFVPGPKKKTPDPSQMSATSEFKGGGKID